MTELPAPLVGPEVDLRDFPFTPMFRARLFGSSFHARVSDAGWRAGVTLWLKSWDQVPAGTLPDDDVDLCRLAELGRDQRRWGKVRAEALHGWFKAADGRLHHRVVAEGVTEAWARKCAQRGRTEAARLARLNKRLSQTTGEEPTETVTRSVTDPPSHHAASVTDSVTETVTGSKGQGQGQGQGKKKESSLRSESVADCEAVNGHGPPDAAELFDRWWAHVPLKKARGQALKAFKAALKTADFAALLAGIERYAAEVAGQNPRFIKYPATWLNGQCWADESLPLTIRTADEQPTSRRLNPIEARLAGTADALADIGKT